jgi:formyl-CoA transferase
VAATGLPDQPIKAGISVADSGTGIACAMSIIAALFQRDRHGVGQKIELAMQDFIIGLSRTGWEPYYNTGKAPKRVGNGMPLEEVAPSDTYPCKPFGINDYVHIYCSRHPGSKQFDNLCKVIGREDLLRDERFGTPHSRYVYKDILDPIIAEWTGNHTKQEAMDILAKADIPAGALLDVDDITKDPQYQKRGMIVEIEHKERGKIKVPGFAPRMSENHVEYQCSPALGEHNDEIYGGVLGLSAEEIAALTQSKVI